MDKLEMQQKLKLALDPKRFKHSINVCEEAVRMAEIFGADRQKAYIAGLLHDCAKCMNSDEEETLCKKYNFIPDEITRLCHPVLHAPLGGVVAKYEYGITDEEIIDAICYHTVARADMTLLDKIIYVADMTEPGRNYEGVNQLRRLAETNIEAAFKEALYHSLVYNLDKRSLIHPGSIEAWNSINKKERFIK